MNPYFSMTNAELRDSDDPGAADELERRKSKRAARSNPRANAFRRNPLTVSGEEARELLLSRGGDDPEFVGMVVRGSLNLSNTQIESLPAGLVVGRHLILHDTPIKSLPAGLKVGGSLKLSDSQIQSLPARLRVGRDLDLSNTPIQSLPAGLQVGEFLILFGTRIKSLPPDLEVGSGIIRE
jgi:hypothetical protein